MRIRQHGPWKTVAVWRTGRSGVFAFGHETTSTKTRWYRVVKRARGHHPRATSKIIKVTIKPWDGRVDVTLTWQGPADLDLSINDAEGVIISADNPHPANSGGVFQSQRGRGCGDSTGGSETISWPAGDAPFGSYMANISIDNPCGDADPQWHLDAKASGQHFVNFDGDKAWLDDGFRVFFGDNMWGWVSGW